MIAVKKNSSVYQVNPSSQMTGEGKTEFSRVWGPGVITKGEQRRGGGGVNPIRARNIYTFYREVVEGMHLFIMCIM